MKERNDLEEYTKKLEEEYKEFAYIVSHDLSAPLRGIEGLMQIIKEKNYDNLDDRSKKLFDIVIDEAAKSKKIISSLMEYFRLHISDNLAFEKIDSSIILNRVIEELDILIKNKGAKIIFDKLPIIRGIEEYIYILFYNLLENALIFQEINSKPIISISATLKEGIWKFCIEDNGIGISPKYQERAFQLLRRANDDEEYTGMGMGLAFAKKIVRIHNGNIFMNTGDKGTKIYVELKAE